MLTLTRLESKLNTLQQRLIDRKSEIATSLKAQPVQDYAEELTLKWFPRSKSEAYRATCQELFAIDLVTAPALQNTKFLWRYNYDHLDVLSNFYKFSHPKQGYFHAKSTRLPPPTEENFLRSAQLLRLNLTDQTNFLFDMYCVRGTRSRIAARIIEQISYYEHDQNLNLTFYFDNDPSVRTKAKMAGKGKFRYLRKGRDYLILGTIPAQKDELGLIDLRTQELDTFGYRVSSRKEVLIAVSPTIIRQFKTQISAILAADRAIFTRLAAVNSTYEKFHLKYRFGNHTNWVALDKWIVGRIANQMQSFPKLDWQAYQASKHRFPVTYLPKRTNFFWNPKEELHCQFHQIWTPYNWEEPVLK